jgi:hypothetical protein
MCLQMNLGRRYGKVVKCASTPLRLPLGMISLLAKLLDDRQLHVTITTTFKIHNSLTLAAVSGC